MAPVRSDHHRCGVDLYVTCATVIPLLFLALIYQVRLFDEPPGRKRKDADLLTAAVSIAILGLLAIIAEGVSLRVLVTGHATRGQRSSVASITWVLILFTFLGPGLLQFTDVVRRMNTSKKRKDTLRTGAAVLFGVAAIVGLVLLNPAS